MSDEGTPQWKATPQRGYQINSTDTSANGGICLSGTSQEYGSGQFAVFCHDRDGTQLWHDPLGENAYQGVFWVAVSSDGRYAAAGGTISETANAAGFLRAYRSESGKRLLDVRLPSRVNQVAVSDDGGRLVAVAGDRLHVYALDDDGYRKIAEQRFAGQYCRTCAIDAGGRRIVVGTSIDSDGSAIAALWGRTMIASNTDAGGAVHVLDTHDRDVQLRITSPSDAGVMHVDMLADGRWWVASRHDGKAMAFMQDITLHDGAPAWIYGPAGVQLDVAYGIAVAMGDDGDVRVVCGANVAGAGHGCLYAVRSRREPGDSPTYTPAALWQHALQFDPNPGINMDRRARWVTATDGQPQNGNTTESAGNFYLFAVDSGRLSWRYPTALMNWPMAISADGCAVYGGSDDGWVYYWTLG